jgi:hypothetical protein
MFVCIFFFSGSTAPLGLGLWFFSFMIILQMVGLLGRVISSSQGLHLNTGQHKHRINAYTYQTSMPCVGFEPTIAASERAKTVHALDGSATMTGCLQINHLRFWFNHIFLEGRRNKFSTLKFLSCSRLVMKDTANFVRSESLKSLSILL